MRFTLSGTAVRRRPGQARRLFFGGAMETWSAREDDRPYVPPQRKAVTWPGFAAALVVLAAMSAGYYYYLLDLRPASRPAAQEATPVPVADAARAAATEPAVANPVPAEEQAPSLPTLDNSDALARDTLIGLLGGPAFDEM